ncbi:DUF4143 domain-containing protein, partial [Candidatus Micrarchaeota archaeon]|nr:DUF4143 domain-containing protein [Candidatus Micrarchaeota archaeon]
DIASDLEISKDTIKEYINILEKSFLIRLIPVYSKRISTSTRRLKKIIFAYPSLANVLVAQSKGRVYENIVYHHIQNYGKIYFWREKYKEVDFVFVRKKQIIPIEVKSGNVNKNDCKNMLAFMDKFNTKKGIIISKDTIDTYKFDKGKTITVLPLITFISNVEKWLL